jgi:hypothetical protein
MKKQPCIIQYMGETKPNNPNSLYANLEHGKEYIVKSAHCRGGDCNYMYSSIIIDMPDGREHRGTYNPDIYKLISGKIPWKRSGK